MGGTSSSRANASRGPKISKKNAYHYAKKLGISKMLFAMDEGAAETAWKQCDVKGKGFIDSKENVSALFKVTASMLLRCLRDEQAKQVQGAKARLGKQFKPTIDKLSNALGAELEDLENATAFLEAVGSDGKLDKTIFVTCMVGGVKINKNGSLEWAYFAKKNATMNKELDKSAPSKQEGKAKQAEVTPPKNRSKPRLKFDSSSDAKGGNLAAPNQGHKKTYSVRQLKVLNKGIYSGSENDSSKGSVAKDFVTETLNSVKDVPISAPESSGVAATGPAAVSPVKAPNAVTIAASPEQKRNNLNLTETWQKRKSKAMAKFATLRCGGEDGYKPKKKKKKKAKAKQ